jgi:hypothetical protein
MAKTGQLKRGKKVSKEMAAVLNRVCGELPARRRAEARRLLAGTAFWEYFFRCTWWGGCYYCQDLQGNWWAEKCYA